MRLPRGCWKDDIHVICNIDGFNVKMKECMYFLGHESICVDFKEKRYFRKDKIFPINMIPENMVESKAYITVNFGNKKIVGNEKPLYHAGFFSDLGEDGDMVEIVNPHRNLVVRKIKVMKDKVFVDACDGDPPVVFDRNTEVLYEPWFMDKGSFVFFNSGNVLPTGLLKIATEGDILREWKQ